ncbi:putative ribonuclease H-like domain-containing protein [Tanacetum coccineum]
MSIYQDYEEMRDRMEDIVALEGTPKGVENHWKKDDFSRFTWVFFLATRTKDEDYGILKSFITGIENLVDHKVKVIRCDNGTEFKNIQNESVCVMIRAIGTKWVFKNKKDERGIVIRNKARLVAQGYTQEEGIDYDEVFALVARIEAIRLFLAYASFKDFLMYQMDVKSTFLYGKIEEEVYVCQPPGFDDRNFPDRVYKVKKALYGLHHLELGMKPCQHICWTIGFKVGKLIRPYSSKGIKMSYVGELIFFLGLQVQQKKDGIFISHDKYIVEKLKKFGFTEVKTASTPMETQKPLLKDEDSEEVDVHMYRLMIGSLMYLTSSRPDIMFAVSTKIGPWYPKDFPFDLVAYTNSDYAGASLDRKSTTGGYQFLGCRLISWQCKKQTVVANSTTEAEYVAVSSCCGQLYSILLGKAKKSVRLMMEKLFRMELELILVT